MGQTHYRGVHPEALGDAVVKASKSSSKGAKPKAPAGRHAGPAAAKPGKAAPPKRAVAPKPAAKPTAAKSSAVKSRAAAAPGKPEKAAKPASPAKGKAALGKSEKGKAADGAKPVTAKVANNGKAGKGQKPAKPEAVVLKAAKEAKDPKDGPPGRMRDPIAPIDTIRTPAKADDLKARLGRISTVIVQLRTLKRTLERSFFEVGELLTEVNDSRLFEVKGYGSLEAFLDRETELGSSTGVRAMRAITIFQKAAAESAGFSRISAALRALDGEPDAPTALDRHSLASLPPHKL